MTGFPAGRTVFVSTALVLGYTVINAMADTAAKAFAHDFEAPQLLALSGGLVAVFSGMAALRKGGVEELRTSVPFAMLLRSILTVVSATFFFWAFRSVPLAEIFIFVGLMPILAALLTPVVLKEKANAKAWAALLVGFLGVICLFPEGISAIHLGHVSAFVGSFSGVVSIVLSRYASKREDKSLALVFYPNLLMCLVMGAALPIVYQPMTSLQAGIAVGYAILLFASRFVLVRAMALAPAHIVTPLMNAQFLWMVVLGAAVFGEIPTLNIYLGAAMVIAACIKLVFDEVMQAEPKQIPVHSHGDRSNPPRSKSWYRSRTNSWHSDYRSRNERRSALR